MSFSPETLLRPHIDALQPYTPIQPFEVLSRRLGIPADEIIKLDANENPYGPLPAVAEALAAHPWYHIYPDPQHEQLRDALSGFVGVPAANILPTHGADEMLDLLCRLFLGQGDRVINCPPTFGMYGFDAALVGAVAEDVPRVDGFATDIAAIEQRLQGGQAASYKMIFVTAPNNPTGNWLPDEDLLRLLQLPALIILDEAYVEFAGKASRAHWVAQHDNLVVLRTFSKAAGIAGLRLGYGICPDWLMPVLWKFKQPYNVNVAASVAGIASLQYADQIDSVVKLLVDERERLLAGLRQVSFLTPHPSEANFVLCDVSASIGAHGVKTALEKKGILVRYYNKPGLDNCIRISVGRPEQTDRLLQALAEIEQQRPGA
jgi:histidinol-phosphate aminotransferase